MRKIFHNHMMVGSSNNQYPEKPGVYLFKNERETVIYVGKAKSLKHRIKSYFASTHDIKTRFLMDKAAHIEIITTTNEYEALLLENNLIKRYKPRYNINLKDGKTYPVIRATNERFPRVFRTRRIVLNGSAYFGPFPKANQIDVYLDLVNRLFPLRKCKGRMRKRSNPCLNYHIGRCSAPCCGLIDEQTYATRVGNVRKLLSGKTEELLRELRETMKTASQELAFEKAAHVRDQIAAVVSLSEDQNVVDLRGEESDYIGLATRGDIYAFSVFQLRAGKLIGRELFRTETYAQEDEALVQFITQYYSKGGNPPRTVFLSSEVPCEPLVAFFRDALKRTVTIRFPKRGKHLKIVTMAVQNAQEDMDRRTAGRQKLTVLSELERALELPSIPKRIEGFDIAHLSGTDTVASMVYFADGLPRTSAYRHYRIRTLSGRIDDFEAIREVVRRRYSRALREDLGLPDLILIDGGKGQVSAVLSALGELGTFGLPVVGLAKREEEVFVPDRTDPIVLEEDSDALRMLQSVRDEAHRFATSYHKKLRAKRLSTSPLESIPGIGKRRANRLLQTFGGTDRLIASSAEDIAKKTGISLQLASSILAHLAPPHSKETAADENAGNHSDTNEVEARTRESEQE